MPLIDRIPLPGPPGEAFMKGAANTQNILDSIMKNSLNPSQMRLNEAQAKQAEAKSTLPFGGQIPPGPAGQTVGLEMVKNLYGEQSPQYKQAKGMYDLSRESDQARINYQGILSESAPKRFSTPLAKSIQELEDIKKGFLPGTERPLSNTQKKYYEGKYGLNLIKQTTDADTRKRALYSNNIDLTLQQLDPNALTQYSGLEGTGRLLKDAADSASGNPSPQYEAYTNALTAADTLAKQVRQFYGDSITAGVQKGLKALTNPTSWVKHPSVALANYNHFVKILKSEQQTFKKSLQSPEVYGQNTEGNIEEQPDEMQNQIQNNKQQSNMKPPAPEGAEVEIYSPQGKFVGYFSKENAARLIKAHKGHYQKVINNE